ncbi:hypothetical protein [Pseudonocardia sp. ICBG1034]|nr:hypothetical protein [Pseudonocardia sp. ICBG1034]
MGKHRHSGPAPESPEPTCACGCSKPKIRGVWIVIGLQLLSRVFEFFKDG